MTIFSIIDEIEKVRDYKSGWNFGEGIPFDIETINDAVSMVSTASTSITSDIDISFFPGNNGEIRICYYFQKKADLLDYLEFTFEGNGKVTFVHEENDTEINYLEELNLSEATTLLLEELKKWKLSELSTPGTMIFKEKDFKVLLLRTQEAKMTEEYPLLTMLV